MEASINKALIIGALNKAGFPHHGLTCPAITSCLPEQSVVLVYLTDSGGNHSINKAHILHNAEMESTGRKGFIIGWHQSDGIETSANTMAVYV